MSEKGKDLDQYTCDQAVARLYEYLDRELPPEEEEVVRRHLEKCAPCFHHFGFDARLLERIREKCEAGPAPEAVRRRVKALLDDL
jgi:mycothiol system anti-sigma-R factor